MKNKILYIDLDGVCADFEHGINLLAPDLLTDVTITSKERSEQIDLLCAQNDQIFHDLKPMPGAIDAVKTLIKYFDVYFLSTPMWSVPNSFTGKRIWIDRYFGKQAEKRLILSHRKDLNIGDYLIDDRTANGAGQFTGEHLHFGTEKYPNWNSILTYLVPAPVIQNATIVYYKNENIELPVRCTHPNPDSISYINFEFPNNFDSNNFYDSNDGKISIILTMLDSENKETAKFLINGTVHTRTCKRAKNSFKHIHLLERASIKIITISELD